MNKEERLTLKESYALNIKTNEEVSKLHTLLEKYHGDVRVNMEKVETNKEEIGKLRSKSNLFDGVISAVMLAIAYFKIKE